MYDELSPLKTHDSAMPFKEHQTVRIRLDQLLYMAPAMARQLDRRKGIVIDVYVPLGESEKRIKVRWKARRETESDMVMEHKEGDLEAI
jgi:hypothetical protein